MKRAANVDRNHAEIVNALRGRGCTVQSLAPVGKGCPDLLVGYCGDNFLFEIKAFKEYTVKGALTPEQLEWHRNWRGQVGVIRCVEDVRWYFPEAVSEGISSRKAVP